MSTRPDRPYPDTYYSATTPLSACQPALQGQTRADVCVVGGGIAGCSAALALAERGYRVVLLEAQRLGWGASGRSGGQVIPGIAVDQEKLEQRLGLADARRIWDISLAGLTLLRERLQTHRIVCDWVDGQMSVAIKPRQWRALQRWHEQLAGDYGYRSTQLLEGERLHAALGSERYLGALLDSNGGHLHPLQYTLGLARAARQCGVQIHEASRMTHYTERSGTGRSGTERSATQPGRTQRGGAGLT